jgi:hypothetical protein
MESRQPIKNSAEDIPVEAAIAPNEIVASIWKSALEENGIACFLKGINFAESLYTAPITLRFQVMVKTSDLARAREILTPFMEEE